MFIDACAKFGDMLLRNIQEVGNGTNKKKCKQSLHHLNNLNWHVNDFVPNSGSLTFTVS